MVISTDLSVRMWAVIQHALDMPFPWALWYGKRPRSFIRPMHFRKPIGALLSMTKKYKVTRFTMNDFCIHGEKIHFMKFENTPMNTMPAWLVWYSLMVQLYLHLTVVLTQLVKDSSNLSIASNDKVTSQINKSVIN